MQFTRYGPENAISKTLFRKTAWNISRTCAATPWRARGRDPSSDTAARTASRTRRTCTASRREPAGVQIEPNRTIAHLPGPFRRVVHQAVVFQAITIPESLPADFALVRLRDRAAERVRLQAALAGERFPARVTFVRLFIVSIVRSWLYDVAWHFFSNVRPGRVVVGRETFQRIFRWFLSFGFDLGYGNALFGRK